MNQVLSIKLQKFIPIITLDVNNTNIICNEIYNYSKIIYANNKYYEYNNEKIDDIIGYELTEQKLFIGKFYDNKILEREDENNKRLTVNIFNDFIEKLRDNINFEYRLISDMLLDLAIIDKLYYIHKNIYDYITNRKESVIEITKDLDAITYDKYFVVIGDKNKYDYNNISKITIQNIKISEVYIIHDNVKNVGEIINNKNSLYNSNILSKYINLLYKTYGEENIKIDIENISANSTKLSILYNIPYNQFMELLYELVYFEV